MVLKYAKAFCKRKVIFNFLCPWKIRKQKMDLDHSKKHSNESLEVAFLVVFCRRDCEASEESVVGIL